MACTSETSTKIAEESIKAMAGQIDLVHGLALAVLGGILALALQVALHNRAKDANRLILEWPLLLLVGIVFPAISMVLGTLAKGTLTSSIPSILKFDFCALGVVRLSSASFDSAKQLAALAAGQSYVFLIGILAMALFTWLNRASLR